MNNKMVWTVTSTFGVILSPITNEHCNARYIDALFSQRMNHHQEGIKAFYKKNPELRNGK